MSEIVTTYLLRDLTEPLPMARDEFYSEQIVVYKKTGKPTRSVEVVQVLLFTTDGELILQKRSRRKDHNPGMFDKTLGGHVRFGDTPTYTLMVETLQELQVPSLVLPSSEDFKKTYRLLKDYLNNIALIQHIDGPRTYTSTKRIGAETMNIANTYHFYLGIYSGSIKPADKEVSGILFFSPETLGEEVKESPELFTEDLRFFLKKYKEKIAEFLKILDSKLGH